VEQLKILDPTSKEVFTTGLIEHYEQTPHELEGVHLADFAAYILYSSKRGNQNTYVENDDEDKDAQQEDADWIPLLNGKGFVCKR
jgi:nitrate reductase alpha subunit